VQGFAKSKNFAFSLIELMIVIAIISVLAVVAVTSYRDYVIRSSIAALIPLAGQAKNDVEDAHNEGTIFGTGGGKTYVASSATDKPLGLYSMTRVDYGCVNITIDLAALRLDNTKTLILTWCPRVDNGSIAWRCGYDSTSYSGYISYFPSNCQASSSSILSTSF
jgi:type IV pilus assembly protein PilA